MAQVMRSLPAGRCFRVGIDRPLVRAQTIGDATVGVFFYRCANVPAARRAA